MLFLVTGYTSIIVSNIYNNDISVSYINVYKIPQILLIGSCFIHQNTYIWGILHYNLLLSKQLWQKLVPGSAAWLKAIYSSWSILTKYLILKHSSTHNTKSIVLQDATMLIYIYIFITEYLFSQYCLTKEWNGRTKISASLLYTDHRKHKCSITIKQFNDLTWQRFEIWSAWCNNICLICKVFVK